MKIKQRISLVLLAIAYQFVFATDYFVHPILGNDQNDGRTKSHAIQTLKRAGELQLLPDDRLLLAGGQIFRGSLSLLKWKGSRDHPIRVESIAWSEKEAVAPAIIDAKGFGHGILVEDCQHIVISLIEITGNGYEKADSTLTMRIGVIIRATTHAGVKSIVLHKLKIRDMFYENPGFVRSKEEVKTENGTQRYGWGIRMFNVQDESIIDGVVVSGCEIENVSHTGIKLTGAGRNIQNIRLINNKITRTGGPGIQMSNVRFVYVAENEVNRSGSFDDTRKWGRGSGLWTWSSSDVLIEKNKFMNANGPGDSAGAHIDYNCDNVVLQYNISANNAGGFCEILGNNYNCAYRYNISINDGYRVKGENGAFQEGKVFWLSGYQGNKERKGPVNTYFYNNTIFVNEKIISKIAIDNRSEGILIANNIFYLLGGASVVPGDQYKPDVATKNDKLTRVFFKNNLYLKNDNWPTDAIIKDSAPLFGDPKFKNAGSLSAEDYKPTNAGIGRGIEIPLLDEDKIGLLRGVKVDEDILGKKSSESPWLGAIAY